MTAELNTSILVVDDEAGMRALVRRCLENHPFAVQDAESGERALGLVADGLGVQPLITDEMMPEMEGHELARRLRAANPNLKVLYLTGHADRLFDAKQHLWELEAYLDKPFTPEGLRQAVALLLHDRLTI